MFPGKDVKALMFINAKGLEKNNDYVSRVSRESGWPALYYSHPDQSADEVEEAVAEEEAFVEEEAAESFEAEEEVTPDYPEGNPFEAEEDIAATRRINLSDLKFGRNYSKDN